MFKVNSEKTSNTNPFSDKAVNEILSIALPNERISSFNLIAGGCAKLNYKIILEHARPLILRIYLRDDDSSAIEKKIGAMLKTHIKSPRISQHL